VSLHYEVVFSLFLRDDTPVEVLDELRWHLGVTDEPPAVRALPDVDWPALRPQEETGWLPGADVAELRRQYRTTRLGVDNYAWALHARCCWYDDERDHVWWDMAAWLAPYAAEEGYAGFYREESEDVPTVLLVRGGRAHEWRPGQEPKAI